MDKKEKGFLDQVVEQVKNFEISGVPGATLDKAVKNFTETGSVLFSKEQLTKKETEEQD